MNLKIIQLLVLITTLGQSEAVIEEICEYFDDCLPEDGKK